MVLLEDHDLLPVPRVLTDGVRTLPGDDVDSTSVVPVIPLNVEASDTCAGT